MISKTFSYLLEYIYLTEYITPEGEYHNLHRPAVSYTAGGYEYFLNGKRQNIVGPSTEDTYHINGCQLLTDLDLAIRQDIIARIQSYIGVYPRAR